MPRRLTGFTSSGNLHLGNYIGAMRPIITEQTNTDTDTVVFVSDLHALTLHHDPTEVRQRTVEFATLLLAAGADPDACLFLVQSHVPEHTELHYLTEVVYDPDRAPGTSNLLAIHASCTGDKPQRLAQHFDRYSELKQAIADAVVATLAPVRQRYVELAADPEHVRAVLRAGVKRAREQASDKVQRAKAALGLLPA